MILNTTTNKIAAVNVTECHNCCYIPYISVL